MLCCFFGDCNLDFDGLGGGVVKHTPSVHLEGDLDLGGELRGASACIIHSVDDLKYCLRVADDSQGKTFSCTELAAA